MDAFLELFSTRGRANRAWYIWHVILDELVIIGGVVFLITMGEIVGKLVVLPMIGVVVAGTWAAIAITVKRLQDMDRPGWHVLLLLVPFYNLYLGLRLIFSPGTRGENRFGPDPLRPGWG